LSVIVLPRIEALSRVAASATATVDSSAVATTATMLVGPHRVSFLAAVVFERLILSTVGSHLGRG
jgi:hypothetical protein